jgi:hypothetical protein
MEEIRDNDGRALAATIRLAQKQAQYSPMIHDDVVMLCVLCCKSTISCSSGDSK